MSVDIPVRALKNEEIGFVVRTFREMMQWSQETLAEKCRVNVRTIQRVEKGESIDLHTKRALASAFEFEDIDYFNKPQPVPTEGNLKSLQEKFEKDYVFLELTLATNAGELASAFASSMADVSKPGIDLAEDAARGYAALTDYLREYRDCASEFTEVAKLDIFAELQAFIDALERVGVSVCYATRDTRLVGPDWPDKQPLPARLIYLSACHAGKMPRTVAVPKKIEFAV